jgi:hypothetical protein
VLDSNNLRLSLFRLHLLQPVEHLAPLAPSLLVPSIVCPTLSLSSTVSPASASSSSGEAAPPHTSELDCLRLRGR